MIKIFVVSDGTGGTARRALNAALTQFEGANPEIIERPNIRCEEEVELVVREVVAAKGFIVHTLVSNEAREAMIHTGRLYNIVTCDLMGPLLERLSQQLSITPSMKPGLFRQLNKAYFRRVETMEYAFHHDDGLRPEEITTAEIILIGISRTFKTPLSIYLAFKGWFVANVPIILDLPLPKILSKLPEGKVIGLRANPYRLAELRRVRDKHLGGATGSYAQPDHVRREMEYALNIFNEHPHWPIVDVTAKPIEEIASEILSLSSQKLKHHRT